VTRKQEWLEQTYKRGKERPARFTTLSDMAVDPLYTPEDVNGNFAQDIGYPGEFPYTRGVYESMYRGRLWTMRQLPGSASPKRPMRAFIFSSRKARTGFRPPSTCRP